MVGAPIRITVQDDVLAQAAACDLRRAAIPATTMRSLHTVFNGVKAHVDKAMEAGVPPDLQASTRWPNGSYGFETAFRVESLKPAAVAVLKSMLGQAGLAKAARDRLGADFVLCIVQSMFRWRPPHRRDRFIGWHQDAKFYGPGIRSMNVWLPMSPCGPDIAPGLDYIDNVTGLVPGQDYRGGGHGNLADGYDAYVATLDPARIQSPVYQPGDLLLFGQDTIHRTTPVSSFTEERVSLELRFLSDIPNSMVFGMNLRSQDLRRLGMM